MDRWPAKDPSGVADYSFVFSLDPGDSIASHTTEVEVGDVTIDSSVVSGPTVTLTLSGGTDGTFAIITANVATAAGRQFNMSALLYIMQSSRPIISLARAKQFLRVTQSSEDSLITSFIHAATAWVENYTGIRLGISTFTEVLESFPDWIDVVNRPLVSVTSVAYTDANGDLATVTGLRVVRNRIFPPEAGWPSPKPETPIQVTYQAGELVTPPDLEAAILLLVGEFYDRRSSDAKAPEMVEMLCRAYRQVML